MGFRFKPILFGRRPLVDYICKADVNLEIEVLVYVKKPQAIQCYLTRFLYNARISNVMVRTRWDLGSSTSGPVEDL
jgi:hypothetical protein